MIVTGSVKIDINSMIIPDSKKSTLKTLKTRLGMILQW